MARESKSKLSPTPQRKVVPGPAARMPWLWIACTVLALVRDCSEETSRQIDEEVRALLDTARKRARTLLETERDQLERVATHLLETETLDRATFDRIVGGRKSAKQSD